MMAQSYLAKIGPCQEERPIRNDKKHFEIFGQEKLQTSHHGQTIRIYDNMIFNKASQNYNCPLVDDIYFYLS